jgi:transposase
MEVSNAFHTKGVLVSHANARLTVHGRRLLVERVLAGHSPADVAHQLGCSRATAYKWLARFRSEGAGGLVDRSSRPHGCPHRTPALLEARILAARRAHRRGAAWIGAELGIAASTVGRVIRRAGLPRLCELDALTGQPVRRGPVSRVRYERRRIGAGPFGDKGIDKRLSSQRPRSPRRIAGRVCVGGVGGEGQLRKVTRAGQERDPPPRRGGAPSAGRLAGAVES